MKKWSDEEIIKKLEYFNDILIPKYEKQFNTSLEDAIFWNPLHISHYPEEVEAAITRLETAMAKNEAIKEDDIQWFSPNVIY